MNLNFDRKHQFKRKPQKYCPLGKAIDQKLDEMDCSLYQFSKEFGLSHSYISHIMRGDYPTSPQIPRLMKALGITDESIAEIHCLEQEIS